RANERNSLSQSVARDCSRLVEHSRELVLEVPGKVLIGARSFHLRKQPKKQLIQGAGRTPSVREHQRRIKASAVSSTEVSDVFRRQIRIGRRECERAGSTFHGKGFPALNGNGLCRSKKRLSESGRE
ncbi:hypothetical protein E2320_022844, partial [Naja naja]